MTRLARWRATFLVAAASALAAVPAVAQQSIPAGRLAEQNLRPYWLVFTAYAIAIVLIMIWAASIAKRLSDVEDQLAE